jgi:hypothetical protein
VDLTLTFNTTITSHIAATGFSEALLLIDEPHGGLSGETNTILACGASGTHDNGSGGCSITSDGIVTDTYNGTAGHPNVFQGQPFSLNAFSWMGIPIDPPGQALSNDHILRFTNLRVNAASLGTPDGSSPNTGSCNDNDHWVMGTIDTRVVRRSNALLGRDYAYQEYAKFDGSLAAAKRRCLRA